MLAAASFLSTSYTLPALRGAPSLAARAPAPSMSLDVASQLSTLLASDASAVPLDAPFISQLGISASLFVGGNVLHSGAFGEVEEPQEVGVEEGVIDIYRDSPLRYCGYLNEVGEAFRPLIPVEIVYLSCGAARCRHHSCLSLSSHASEASSAGRPYPTLGWSAPAGMWAQSRTSSQTPSTRAARAARRARLSRRRSTA